MIVASALIGATVAAGSGSSSQGSTTTGTTSTDPRPNPNRTPETPLAGDVLAKVKAAAVAKVGGTVDFATTENDGSLAGAAYEAHVTKTDGTHVEVILDKDYNVLAVDTRHGPGGPGGPGCHGGPGNGETPLTGDTLAKAKAAALAKVAGGTFESASTENDSSNADAKYEVHVTKSDGTHVEVILDQDFDVLGVEDRPAHGPHGPHGDGHGFRHH